MFYVSEIYNDAPKEFESALQEEIYKTLGTLGIKYSRVKTDEAITMDDCTAIDEKLDMKMVKTLFLCNRQKTEFYLFVTCGDKPFSSKNFSNALNISRVSFAPAELMEEMLGTKIGAATVLSVLKDKENKVKTVIDSPVADSEFYGCSDSATTGYMKIATSDVIGKFLPYANHTPIIAEV